MSLQLDFSHVYFLPVLFFFPCFLYALFFLHSFLSMFFLHLHLSDQRLLKVETNSVQRLPLQIKKKNLEIKVK